MMTRLLKNFLTGVTLCVLSLGLAACMTTGGKSPKEESDASKNADNKSANVVALNDDECPGIEILDGTGVLTAYVGDGTEKPENIAHQATFVRSGRQCSIIDGVLSLNIRAAGRAAKGPKSVDDTVMLPVRIAVLRGENEVLFSQLYNRLIPFKSDGPTEFVIKEDGIRLPDDKKDGIKILIGFDTIGSDNTASNSNQNPSG